jgi:uncharacterized phage-associated protein
MNSIFNIASAEFSAQDIAHYLRYLSRNQEMEKLKLQKLLYYAQGLYLVAYKKPLFKQPIENWEHGPVVRDVYVSCRSETTDKVLPVVQEPPQLTDSTKTFLTVIHESFNSHSGWSLREQTHLESPWADTRPNEIISLEALFDHFEDHVILDSTSIPILAVPEIRHVVVNGKKYSYTYIPDLQEGGYVANVSKLPGCMTDGNTLVELHENVQSAIEDWLSAR